MKKVCIISGANKGLGEAFFDVFIARKDYLVISLSRKLSVKQQELSRQNDPSFLYVMSDFAKENSFDELEEVLLKLGALDELIFISNAGAIHPLGNYKDATRDSLMESIGVNVIAPSLIINKLLSLPNVLKTKIVNISSGAADRPIDGWATYCASKAFMKMLLTTVKLENETNPALEIHNVNPGVMDTDMQMEIRGAGNFASHEDFVDLKKNNKLRLPKDVARDIIEKFGL